MIKRIQIPFAQKRLFKGKALIIYGPRQAGKTTFAEQLLQIIPGKKVLRLNADEADIRELVSKPNSVKLKHIIGKNQVLFLDEAQRIPEAGVLLKLLVDQFKNLQVIATGSSSFELAGKIKEPLTGRKYEIQLLPLSYQELVNHTGLLTENRLLEQRLIFGSYPEIVTKPGDAVEHLKLLTDSYLYKDLFALEQIKKPVLLEKIVKSLALQVGSEVSITEIGQMVNADNKTVEKYISLLEKAFVIFTLNAFAGNVRNEIKKSRKIYFYDTGIINAVNSNFNSLHNRSDVGSLWENYLVSERIKFLSQHILEARSFFWRTAQQQEIDYIEQNKNTLLAAEFKWNPKARHRFPVTFLNAYPEAATMLITPDNREYFLGEKQKI